MRGPTPRNKNNFLPRSPVNTPDQTRMMVAEHHVCPYVDILVRAFFIRTLEFHLQINFLNNLMTLQVKLS